MAAHVTIGGVEYPVVFDAPGEMANILQLTEITDPSFLKLYGVLEGDTVPDRQITYVNLIRLLLEKSSVRANQHTVTVGNNTVVFKIAGVNTPFTVLTYSLVMFGASEIGIYDVVKTTGGFTFKAMGAGTINYIATLNT